MKRPELPITLLQVLSIWFGIALIALCGWACVVLAFAVSIRLAVPPLLDAWKRLRRPAVHPAAVVAPLRRCARLERRPRREETGGRPA